MCSKLTIKTPERRQFSTVNCEQVNAGWVGARSPRKFAKTEKIQN